MPMQNNYQTNNDKILFLVLSQKKLIEYGNYDPEDYRSVNEALDSTNVIVHTVAQIISDSNNYSVKVIYNRIHNYLMSNI